MVMTDSEAVAGLSSVASVRVVLLSMFELFVLLAVGTLTTVVVLMECVAGVEANVVANGADVAAAAAAASAEEVEGEQHSSKANSSRTYGSCDNIFHEWRP